MQKMSNARLSQKIAEEAQLLAEEKWIIGALSVLSRQKNSLHIERLNLDHLRTQLIKGEQGEGSPETSSGAGKAGQDQSCPQPSTSTDITQIQPQGVAPVLGTSLLDYDIPVAGIDDEMCNQEKLNLSITHSVFTPQDISIFDMEEEDDDLDNCVIDMNMFMYGK